MACLTPDLKLWWYCSLKRASYSPNSRAARWTTLYPLISLSTKERLHRQDWRGNIKLLQAKGNEISVLDIVDASSLSFCDILIWPLLCVWAHCFQCSSTLIRVCSCYSELERQIFLKGSVNIQPVDVTWEQMEIFFWYEASCRVRRHALLTALGRFGCSAYAFSLCNWAS